MMMNNNNRPTEHKSVRRRRLKLATTAATSIAFSISMMAATAFLMPSSINNNKITNIRPAARSRMPRYVVTDADTLLLESIRNNGEMYGSTSSRQKSAAEDDAERIFHISMSPRDDNLEEAFNNDKIRRNNALATTTTTMTTTADPPTKKRKRVSMKKRNTKSSSSSNKNRSSTMPGFHSITDRQKAYRDGIRLVEERTGRKVIETPEQYRERRTINGQDMYKNSPTVPDSLVQFADEIHQEERITRSEEIELGEKTQEAIRLQNLYDSLEEKLQREPTDEEWCAAAGKINMEAIRQAIEEGLEAKNKLVTSNLRMVQSVVNTYIRNGLSAQYNAGDLMQDGIIALIRAAEKFEPDRGWKFSTYAMYWVRASVKRSQIYQSRIVTVPQRLYENHKRLIRVEKQIIASTGKKPSRKELGEAVGMSELQVNRCIAAMDQRFYSLDAQLHNSHKPMKGEDNSKDTMVEIVASTSADNEGNGLARVLLREDLIETLHRHLTPGEVELLLLRYGLKDDSPPPPEHRTNLNGGRLVTIAELSRIVGIKPDKVRRTINNSLKQLKNVGMEEWLAFEQELQ